MLRPSECVLNKGINEREAPFLCVKLNYLGMCIAQNLMPWRMVGSAPGPEDGHAQTSAHVDWKLSSLSARASSDLTPHYHSEGQRCRFLLQRVTEINNSTLSAVQLVTGTAEFFCPKSADSVTVALTL